MAKALVESENLSRTTIYFTHYLFETYYRLGAAETLERFGMWFGLEEQGLKTTIEEPEPSRSDCHAWGAHPVYHWYATILGIRPAGAGFRRRSEIAPMLPGRAWTSVSGALVHPSGEMEGLAAP